MLWVSLGASLLGHSLTDKDMKAKIHEPGVIKVGKGAIATSQGRDTIRERQDF